jgi:hypothetical protein
MAVGRYTEPGLKVFGNDYPTMCDSFPLTHSHCRAQLFDLICAPPQ